MRTEIQSLPPTPIEVGQLQQWLGAIDPEGSEHLAGILRARYGGDVAATYEQLGQHLALPERTVRAREHTALNWLARQDWLAWADAGHLPTGTRLRVALEEHEPCELEPEPPGEPVAFDPAPAIVTAATTTDVATEAAGPVATTLVLESQATGEAPAVVKVDVELAAPEGVADHSEPRAPRRRRDDR
jgi:hypothetical protein